MVAVEEVVGEDAHVFDDVDIGAGDNVERVATFPARGDSVAEGSVRNCERVGADKLGDKAISSRLVTAGD